MAQDAASSQKFIESRWPLLAAMAIAVGGVLIYCFGLQWKGITLTVKTGDIAAKLGALAFAATAIERAVEIIISPWRDPDANKKEKKVNELKAQPDYPATRAANSTQMQNASDDLADYKGQTQKYAAAIALLFGLLVSIAGVHTLSPFLDSTNASAFTSSHQEAFFNTVDVLLTSALLAGGADGAHSFINSVTSFFDTSTQQKKDQAQQQAQTAHQ